MKTTVIIALLSITFSLLQSCTNSSQSLAGADTEETKAPTIVIYGSNTCHHCVDFKNKLDSVGLKYVFNDVEVDERQAQVMIQLVQSANHQGGIQFPVVYLNDKEVMIAPDFNSFLTRL